MTPVLEEQPSKIWPFLIKKEVKWVLGKYIGYDIGMQKGVFIFLEELLVAQTFSQELTTDFWTFCVSFQQTISWL